MEAYAISKFARITPRKARQVVDIIRGKNVNEALHILKFTHKSAAIHVEKTLRSAIANAVNKEEGTKIDADTLYIKKAIVNAGASYKRYRAAPHGRAVRVLKRTSHIMIVVAEHTDTTV